MRVAKSASVLLGVGLFCIPIYVRAQYKEIDSLASNIATQIPTAPNKTVAVADAFLDLQGNETELGRFLAEELSIAMSRTQGLRVIDRAHLKALLQEHKLASTGIIDPATQKKLEIAGVHVLITGTITPFGDSVRCAIKALNIATAQIEAASTAEIPRTKTIEELLSRGISAMPNQPGPSARGNYDTREPSKSPSASNQTVQVQESHQFSFSLSSCNQTGDVLICALRIVNKGQDRHLTLATHWHDVRTRIIDLLGREYDADAVHFGAYTNNNVQNTLVTGISLAAEIRFSKIPAKLNSLALLEIDCLSGQEFGIQFRDVPVN